MSDPQIWTEVNVLESLGGAPLMLARGPENLDIPQCKRFALRGERTCGKDGQEDDRLVETKHEPPGKLQKTSPLLIVEAHLLSKHCTFHPRGPELRGGGEEKLPVSHAGKYTNIRCSESAEVSGWNQIVCDNHWISSCFTSGHVVT